MHICSHAACSAQLHAAQEADRACNYAASNWQLLSRPCCMLCNARGLQCANPCKYAARGLHLCCTQACRVSTRPLQICCTGFAHGVRVMHSSEGLQIYSDRACEYAAPGLAHRVSTVTATSMQAAGKFCAGPGPANIMHRVSNYIIPQRHKAN